MYVFHFLWHCLFKKFSCKPECLAFCVNEGKQTECYKSLDINQIIFLGQSFFFLEKSRVGNSLFRSSLFHYFALPFFALSLFCSLLFRSKLLILKSNCERFALVALRKRAIRLKKPIYVWIFLLFPPPYYAQERFAHDKRAMGVIRSYERIPNPGK